jgi:DNA-binding transcriptional MerR regulator
MTSIEKSDTALKTIGEVAIQLDVATHVLRFWESKFHQIKPQKRRGRRYYRSEDVATITKIKELLYKNGYTIKGVQKYLLEELRNKNVKVSEPVASSTTSAPVSTPAVPNAPLNPALFGHNVAQKASQPDFTSFKTDIFGNIIPANGVTGFAGNQSLPKAAVKPENDANTQENIAKLKQIYGGLQEARQRLKEVA